MKHTKENPEKEFPRQEEYLAMTPENQLKLYKHIGKDAFAAQIGLTPPTDPDEGKDPAAENKEHGTSDLSPEERAESQLIETVEIANQLADANAKNAALEKELGEANEDVAKLTRLMEDVMKAPPPAARAEGRILGKGTSFPLGDTMVTLAEDVAITYPDQDNEQKFVGMLTTSAAPQGNFDANKHTLANVYSPSTGAFIEEKDEE